MGTKTLIIGGGLSGLRLAEELETKDQDYLLVEARERFGGRILTEHHGTGYFDLGPAWFWPSQPRIAALVNRLGIQKFDQFADGILTMEDEQGQVHRGRGHASMRGSWRLHGGLGALIKALSDRLPNARKRFNAQVVGLTETKEGVTATFINGEEIQASQIVFALPPRIVAGLKFTPELPKSTLKIMTDIATWMASQAKAVAIYDTPFWREEGLSGDVMSRAGPMVEIHDASPHEGGPFALFGFVGVPPEDRRDVPELRQQILAQLSRLFGPQAGEPVKLYVKDWANDPHTTTDLDMAPLYTHPTYRPLPNLWNGKIHFAGTEVAPQFGGYLEGALEAAENTALALVGAQS